MKAALCPGTKSIELGSVPKPTLTAPKDAIVHITHCTICGSDLHMYNGDMNKVMERTAYRVLPDCHLLRSLY
jgi:threonine dehydrogenase-like Zn-dependent dehydrogenase